VTWDGYLTISGNEIINQTRTAQYARAARVPWFKDQEVNDYLPLLLGDGPRYQTPLLDNAPWTDPDVPESYDFLGFYPLEIAGIEDSSRGAEVVQYISDGGSAGRVRHATKSIVVNGMLMATSDAGADYGMKWLRQATLGGPCDGEPFGGDLCYFSASPQLNIPEDPAIIALLDGGDADGDDGAVMDGGGPTTVGVDVYDGGTPWTGPYVIERSEESLVVPPPIDWDPEECLTPYRRTLRKFRVLGGPTVSQKHGVAWGALWSVQFTGIAGVPWEFGATVDVVSGFLGDNVEGVAIDLDTEGVVVEDEDCQVPLWGPMVDPLCPVLVSPPGPVDVPLGCAVLPANWRRRQFTIPADAVPLWSDMVPVLQVHAPAQAELRNLRLRFYSDPFNESNPSLDPCAYCGDILISYIPEGATMTIDAASEAVYVTIPGGIQRRAENLVLGANGKPFDWPALTCGFAYVVTVDLPQTQPLPLVDLALIPRAR
jgi:hypothetical protein